MQGARIRRREEAKVFQVEEGSKPVRQRGRPAGRARTPGWEALSSSGAGAASRAVGFWPPLQT